MKLFTLLIVLSVTANFLFAQPGSLDLSFNDSGKVFVTGFGIARATAVQADGKILVGGEHFTDTTDQFIIARYMPDGTLDASFGDQGIVTTEFITAGIYSLTVLKNGKILASGYGYVSSDFNAKTSPLLAQYLPDGTPDLTFGDGGKVGINTGKLYGAPVYARAMQVMEDGTIVQAGDNGGSETIIIRYKPDGSLDKGFGLNGIDHVYVSGLDDITSLVIQPDGKMVVGGEYRSGSDGNFLIARLKEDGSLDSSFGINGKRNINFYSNEDRINALALQPDGKILAAGRVDKNGLTTPAMTLVRFKPDGAFDSSFGKNGIAFADFGDMVSVIYSIALQNNGEIIAGGLVATPQNSDTPASYFALAQFNAYGSLNTSFGDNGVVITKFDNYYTLAASISLQADGKIVAAGQANPVVSDDSLPYDNLALARYNNNGTPIAKKIKKLLRWVYNHEKGVTLSWQNTATGSTGYYVAQRSGGNTNTVAWAELGRVSVGSNEQAVQTYSFTDNSPLQGANYYRIQQVSIPGNVETSNVVAVTVNAEDAAISVSPNPVTDVLRINRLDASATYSLQVINGQGRTVMNASVKQASLYNLNVQGLAKGLYYLKLVSGNKITALKFVKE